MAGKIDNFKGKEHTLTAEEQSRGGKASVEARRKRKTLKEELLAMLENEEVQQSITTSLIEQAQNGNVKAFEVIRDSIGEKPIDKVAVGSVDAETMAEVSAKVKAEFSETDNDTGRSN